LFKYNRPRFIAYKEAPVLRIILVRHGQTDWNDGAAAGEHFRGRIDIALNATGIAQAKSVANCLALVDVKAIYASPLQRAMDTARPVAAKHDLAVSPFQGLLDIDYGLWGSRSHRQVAAKWPEMYRKWKTAPQEVQIPGGESLDEVRQRIDQALEILSRDHDGEIVVLVGHQVVNKVLVCRLLGLDNSAFWRIRQDTGCINRFDYDGQTATALTINETGHLPIHPRALDELHPT
jgi:probable phosphoglycerate mutase